MIQRHDHSMRDVWNTKWGCADWVHYPTNHNDWDEVHKHRSGYVNQLLLWVLHHQVWDCRMRIGRANSHLYCGGWWQPRKCPTIQTSKSAKTDILYTSSALFDDCGLESLGVCCRCKERWQCEQDKTSKTQSALPYRHGGWRYWTSARLELVTKQIADLN